MKIECYRPIWTDRHIYICTARAPLGAKKSYVNQKRFPLAFLLLCKMSKNKCCKSDFRVSVLSPDSSEPRISGLCFPLAQSRPGCSSRPGLPGSLPSCTMSPCHCMSSPFIIINGAVYLMCVRQKLFV